MYLKNRAIGNKIKYKKRNNYCKRLYKKQQRGFYSIFELNHIKDNKLFWNTLKPFLSDKNIQYSAITFVNKENNQIMPEDLELAETFDYYSVIAVANLGTKEYESSATDNKISE